MISSKKGNNHALNVDSFAFISNFYIFSHLTLTVIFLDDKSMNIIEVIDMTLRKYYVIWPSENCKVLLQSFWGNKQI